jgi:hypothetical protein
MNEISIDRGVLERILKEYFRLLSSETARITLLNEA